MNDLEHLAYEAARVGLRQLRPLRRGAQDKAGCGILLGELRLDRRLAEQLVVLKDLARLELELGLLLRLLGLGWREARRRREAWEAWRRVLVLVVARVGRRRMPGRRCGASVAASRLSRW